MSVNAVPTYGSTDFLPTSMTGAVDLIGDCGTGLRRLTSAG
ncbi:hypothetical protein ABH922_002364 [Rhodococcus sp. 27YEA15]